MQRICCPFCGERERGEFQFRITVPGAGEAFERTYLRRENERVSEEYWQHVRGCRAWLRLTRDLHDGRVIACSLLGAEPTS